MKIISFLKKRSVKTTPAQQYETSAKPGPCYAGYPTEEDFRRESEKLAEIERRIDNGELQETIIIGPEPDDFDYDIALM